MGCQFTLRLSRRQKCEIFVGLDEPRECDSFFSCTWSWSIWPAVTWSHSSIVTRYPRIQLGSIVRRLFLLLMPSIVWVIFIGRLRVVEIRVQYLIWQGCQTGQYVDRRIWTLETGRFRHVCEDGSGSASIDRHPVRSIISLSWFRMVLFDRTHLLAHLTTSVPKSWDCKVQWASMDVRSIGGQSEWCSTRC